MANNNKNSSNNTALSKLGKKINKMDLTTMIMIVLILVILYLVLFKDNKIKLFNHRHQKNNEGFNNQLVKDGKCALVLFHADWCGYCKRFMPTWNEAKNKLQSNDVKLIDYEADADKEVMEKNGVKGYPTLKLFKKNGQVVEYEGDRSLEDLARFINENKD